MEKVDIGNLKEMKITELNKLAKGLNVNGMSGAGNRILFLKFFRHKQKRKG